MKRGDSKVAIGYIRVSTDEQAQGPRAQRDALERWAAREGVRLAVVFEDLGVSGAAPVDKRPGLLAAVGALGEHGAGLLVVVKWDRVARDVLVGAMVERLAERKGARVVSADGVGNGESPEAGMMRGIVGVFAQYERALIRTRTKAALAAKRQRKERTGGVPYGWTLAADGIHLEPHPAEQAMISEARALQAEGLSLRKIGAELERRQMLPRSGSHWHPKTVQGLLQAPVAEAA